MERGNLVIERRLNESVLIGDAKVTVVRTGERVKLCIEAPKNVKILRSEIDGKRVGG